MPYRVNPTTIDTGGFLTTLNFAGRIDSPPGSFLDAAPSAVGMLTFPVAPPMLPANATLHITDSGTGGDIFRSGSGGPFPPDPAPLEIISVPAASTRFTPAEIIAFLGIPAAGLTIPMTQEVIWASTLASGYTLVPTSLTIATITPGTAPLSFTLAGTLTFQQFWFITRTIGWTGTITLAVAPSADASDRKRILSVRVATASLTAGFISPGVNFLLSTLAPIVARLLSGLLEAEVNKAILAAADAAVAKMMPPRRLAPTACICAQRVVATPAGVAVMTVLSNLFGSPAPAVQAPPAKLQLAISPAPAEGMETTYAFTVSAGGAAVAGAEIRLTNFRTATIAQTLTATTDAAGKASLTANLRTGRRRVRVNGQWEVEETPPTVEVRKAGFAPLEQTLA